ncbi:laminin subunit beta-3 [Callorhinchus milii]|uniref:laminin subunit beta-3 n=1 Tax=Callorhinchus milii TaxID=7868 RepID=UPI001C3F5195|nr:laminin subunit beta-3 [Callorhinchus milii]
MFLLLLSLAAASCVAVQGDCSRAACYPPSVELLLGRASQLRASSTCGLHGSQKYCSPTFIYGQWMLQCCVCDSRNSLSSNTQRISHRIENVLPSGDGKTWWQSENNRDQVTIQLDMEGKFQLNDVFLKFKTSRPAALMIERSTDSGQTWKPYKYLAEDCALYFPQISTNHPQNFNDVFCEFMPLRQDASDKQLTFSPLKQADFIGAYNSDKINNLTPFTNLRINFLKPQKQSDSFYLRNADAYYDVYEMKVQGSCFCNGHADRCVSQSIFNPRGPRPSVPVQCGCRHNTAGKNCEMCMDFYNDQPWKPASDHNTNECKKCNCNNHSQKCHFDEQIFRASGGSSGGVCEDCQHNTMGKNCETCKPFFYRGPQRDVTAFDTCIPCECDRSGSLSGGMCDQQTGRCQCKENVEGQRCDRCKAGFYALSSSNPQGCRGCSCSWIGSRSDGGCNQGNGQCDCLPKVTGPTCDRCAPGFWNLRSGSGCQACNCDPSKSTSHQCDQVTGQCPCKSFFTGKTCSVEVLRECPDNYYGDPATQCHRCKCDPTGTQTGGCDKRTGECLCRLPFTGRRCDECRRGRGYCSVYPGCKQCHPCFQIVDSKLSILAARYKTLINIQLPGRVGPNYDSQIRDIENKLKEVKAVITNPAMRESAIREAYDKFNRLREEASWINPNVNIKDESFQLNRRMEILESDIRFINNQFQTKKSQVDQILREGGLGTQDAYDSILSSYNRSGKAKDKVAGLEPTIIMSRKARLNATRMIEELNPDNSNRLKKLKQDMKSPDLTPLGNKVCGGSRNEPCTPETCPEDICPKFCIGANCSKGSLQLAAKAIEAAEKTSSSLPRVNSRIAQLSKQLQTTEQMAQRIKLNSLELSNRVNSAKRLIQANIADVKYLIGTIRDFLTSSQVDPKDIQKISEYVLSLSLPTDDFTINSKIRELRRVAANLPDVSKFLADTKEDVEKAKRLLEFANSARDQATDVKNKISEVNNALRDTDDALKQANTRIKNARTTIDDTADKIEEIENLQYPVDNDLQDIIGRLQGVSQAIDDLEKQNNLNRLKAKDAEKKANDAEDMGDEAEQNMNELTRLYRKLKNTVPVAQPGNLTDRINAVKLEAADYIKEMQEIVQKIAEVEQNLAEGNKNLERRSSTLDNYQSRVKNITDYIREKARAYDGCI